ncbi:MAG: hypothetical protein K2F57_00210 [Candidatus Gastranaerophilales bacterium]|nr:hypothetical protein [Candidatus Gastranaerophilales bacterium]
MKKFILFLVTIFFVIFTSGCDNEQALILFNKHKFTPDTINSPSNTNVFKPNERIYYLITLPKPVESKFLMIQIVKVGGDKDERLGYDLVWGKKVKLRDEQKHYYTDYIVLSGTGAYIMKVYSRDNPTKILTTGNFYVK